jgi:hypothetical protein
MQTATQAIKVARAAEGWSWIVVDGDGRPTLAGSAPEQQVAMETAWRAARSLGGGRGNAYPDIIVERGEPNSGAASSSN